MEQTSTYKTREEAVAVSCSAYSSTTVCASCGQRWGAHIGALCNTATFSTFRPVPRGVPIEDKPTVASPGDQLIYDAMAAAYLSAKGFAEIQAKSAATPQPTKERTRPALTWADPAPDFDPWKGFFTEPADMADWQDTYYPR
jgi:hypothetical protein